MKNEFLARAFSIPPKLEEELPFLYKRYHISYLLIIFFHPLWGVVLNYLLPQFHDPLHYRLITAAAALASDFFSRHFNLSYKKRYILMLLNVFFLNFHVLWITAGTDNNAMYVLGAYMLFIGTGVTSDDAKTLNFHVALLTPVLILLNGNVANSNLPISVIYFLFLTGAAINFFVLRDRFQFIAKLRYLNDEIKQKSKELDQERINTFNASKLASLGDMAGGIAHEMNNPLAIIQGFARKLKRSITDNRETSVEESVKSLEKIVETTNRMALIIEKLKKFSRDGTNDEMTMISPVELVNSVVQFFDERFKTDLIKCTRQMNERELQDTAVFCREVEISQVLINLINNAIYAAKENILREAQVTIGCYADTDFIYFTVEDSGAGIPKEIEAKIFEPFFTTKQEIKATGLGLSIGRTVVEEYGGSISLDRQKNDSTLFIVKLKKARVAPAL